MTTITLPDFTPDQPAAQADAALRQALSACDRAQESAVLWFAEIQRRALYRELGHATLELYATTALSFTRNRYFQFKGLADDLERLPRLREAVAAGTLGWTKAKQVASVATPESEDGWLRRAAEVGRRELAVEVKRARVAAKVRRVEAASAQLAFEPPAAAVVATVAEEPPTTLAFRLDAIQLARYEAAIELIRKLGLVPREAGRAEILLAALDALLETAQERPAGEPELCRHKCRKSKPSAQIIIRRCPECERAAVVTSQGEKLLAPAQAEAAACDAIVCDEQGHNQATIKPSVRAAVMARDGHRCTTPGCGATRFLEVHHVVPRNAGGSNRAENLVTLCARCHRFSHESGHR